MPFIEKYVYDWVVARDRALRAKCSFNKKGEVVENTDPESFIELAKAEQALDRYVRQWLELEGEARFERALDTMPDLSFKDSSVGPLPHSPVEDKQ